jgi:hypothetical protein
MHDLYTEDEEDRQEERVLSDASSLALVVP